MRLMWVVGAALTVAACAEGPVEGLSSACRSAEENRGRCAGDLVQVCREGQWRPVRDCGQQGLACGPVGVLPFIYGCVVGEESLEPTCTYSGHTSAASEAYYDPEFRSRQRLLSFDHPTDPSEVVVLDNWTQFPGSVPPGETAALNLTGDYRDVVACGVCILAQRGSQFFFADAGAAVLSAPSGVGAEMSLSMTNVVLRETDAEGNTLAGGDTWCLDSVYLTAGSTRWLCDEVTGFDEGERLCAAPTSPPGYHILSCENGFIRKTEDCDTQGLVCSSSDNPSAICRSP